MREQTLEKYRDFLKDTVRQTLDFSHTHQARRVPPPPLLDRLMGVDGTEEFAIYLAPVGRV